MPERSSPAPAVRARRRGGQVGNTNAVKHGFYSRQLKKRDLADLENSEFKGLTEEISLLRIYIRQVVDLGKDVRDLFTAMELMRVICLATANLARLVRVQQVLVDPHNDLEMALAEVIEEVNRQQAGESDNLLPGCARPASSPLNPGPPDREVGETPGVA